MGDKVRRGLGAPFYEPPRRKTSAEIISEARAAIYGAEAPSSGGGSGALRALRTRRPFTPREPQRTLFSDRARKKDARPPSAFDLKYLTLSESEEALAAAVSNGLVGDQRSPVNGALLAEPQNVPRKKPTLRNQSRSIPERNSEGWGGFPRLPHLSGRSKPLHRRNTSTTPASDERKDETELAQAISITRPLGSDGDSMLSSCYINDNHAGKSLSPEASTKRQRAFVGSKSMSCDASTGGLGDIAVKHITAPVTSVTTTNYKSLGALELAEALSDRYREVDRVVSLLEALQNVLELDSCSGSLRDFVLRSLYTHVDSEDERVLVGIARAMLTMRVIGNHLATACKLVFKIARNDKNDHFFKNTNLLDLLVEGCGRADPVSEGECCVYGAGALRFLSLEPQLRARAHAAGALHLAALHLKILNSAKAEDPRSVSEHSTHALYQLTGALRNLAGPSGGEKEAKSFVASGALGELVSALMCHTDRDVLTNVARCLSVLSAEESCCSWLCGRSASAGAVCRALAACGARAPLTVRLAYTLGNMAAADEHARINIYNEEGAVDVLLTILETYSKRNADVRDVDSDPDLHLLGTDLGSSDGSNEDVLIKTVRVIANMCLAERAGRGLATTHAERTIRALLACLEVAEKGRDDTDPSLGGDNNNTEDRREELATAALATLNNITFYREPSEIDPPDSVDELIDEVCIVTCRWLSRVHDASGHEAVRALGNLSRGARHARLLVLHDALTPLQDYLLHEDSNVRCAAAGVLVNVCGAAGGGACIEGARCAGAALARGAGRGVGGVSAAALLARALWNAHAHQPLAPHTARYAANALQMLIDDESVFAACEASTSRTGERRASDTELSRHVKFDIENNNEGKIYCNKQFVKAYSCDQELNVEHSDDDADRTGFSGEDLGFEEGELEEQCECEPCTRLAQWEQLVGVAIPLLEKLRPHRADASVGTD